MTGLKAVFAAVSADKFFAACLAWPALILMAFAGIYEWEFRSGRVFAFPVEKPERASSALSKSFFSGWRLEYTVDYGLPAAALPEDLPGKSHLKKAAGAGRPVYLCLEPGETRHIAQKAAACPGSFIRGRLAPSLEGGRPALRFQAKSLRRFYLSEKQARPAEKLFSKAEKKEILVSVTKRGAARLRDLLIEGRSLKSLPAAPE